MRPSGLTPTGFRTAEVKGDWNKFWPTADNQQLKKCTSCGTRLAVTRSGYIHPNERHQRYPRMHYFYYQECLACDLVWIWSHPNVYIEYKLHTPHIVRSEN